MDSFLVQASCRVPSFWENVVTAADIFRCGFRFDVEMENPVLFWNDVWWAKSLLEIYLLSLCLRSRMGGSFLAHFV